LLLLLLKLIASFKPVSLVCKHLSTPLHLVCNTWHCVNHSVIIIIITIIIIVITELLSTIVHVTFWV